MKMIFKSIINIMIILSLIALGVAINANICVNKVNSFCEEVYPGDKPRSYFDILYTTTNIEEGYVVCYRYILTDNHTYVKEEKVFRYGEWCGKYA